MATMNLSLIVSMLNNTRAGANKINSTLDSVRNKARQAGKGFVDGVAPAFTGDAFEQNLSKLEQRASKARGRLVGALAMGAALFVPVRLAAQFDQSMKGLEKVLNNVSTDRLKELRDFLLNTSKIVPIAARDLTDLMAEAAQGGVPVDELESFTLFVAKAAVAFDMAGGVIGESFAKLRNVYKLNQAGVEDLGDAINHLSNNMAAKAAQILNFTNRANSAAQVFKMSAVEMAAFATAMIAAGIMPETGARGLNALANNIIAGGKKVEGGLKKLGISRKQFLKEMKEDGAGALLKLLETMGKSEKGMEALIDIAGKDFADDFGKLIGNIELVKEALGLVKDKSDYAGSATDEAAKQAEGAERKWDLFKNKLTAVAIQLGTVLLPPMLQVMDAVGNLVDSFSEFASANPELTNSIVMAAAGLLAFGIASRVLGFIWASTALQLFKFIGLFVRFNKAGRNVSAIARGFRGLKRIMGALNPLKWGRLIPVLKWVLFIPKLAWKVLIAPFKWLAYIPKLAWKVLITPLKWLLFIPKLSWGKLITPIKWLSLIPKLSWRLLIVPLKWGARLIPGIGWALLLGELAWSLVIKPLGWDEYLKLDYLKEKLNKAKKWIMELLSLSSSASKEPKDRPSKPIQQGVDDPEGFRDLFADQFGDDKSAGGSSKNKWHNSDIPQGPQYTNGPIIRLAKPVYNVPDNQGNASSPGQAIVQPVVDGVRDMLSSGQIKQEVDATINAAVIDKRPPNVTVHAPITVNEAANAQATAASVRSQLGAAVSDAKSGALHDGVE